MTRSIIIEDNQVAFQNCPAGLFVYDGVLCMKTDKKLEAYVISNGKKFDGGTKDESELAKIMVNPCFCEGGSRGINTEGTIKDNVSGAERKTHPSYGLISFNRTHSSNAIPLFGSSIKHRNPIRMTISHADVDRELNKDWYYDRGRIVEIEMSQSQFADAITSFGQGSGVPCTILFSERDGHIPKCDYVSKTEQFSNEFSEHLSNTELAIKKCLDEMKEIFDTKKNLTKSDREQILKILEKARGNVGGNAEFIFDSFAEQMDKTVQEAKGEIESFMQNKVSNFAAMAIADSKEDSLKMIESVENPIDVE